MKAGDLVKITNRKRYIVDELDIDVTELYGLFIRYFGKGIYKVEEQCLVYFGRMGIKLVNKKLLEII
jgi:hypothetical protein